MKNFIHLVFVHFVYFTLLYDDYAKLVLLPLEGIISSRILKKKLKDSQGEVTVVARL